MMFWQITLLAYIAFFSWTSSFSQVQTVFLTSDKNISWQFRQAGSSGWYPATVPGTVHTDLLANKMIEDPFFGDNEKKVQWIDTCSWEYQAWFDCDPSILNASHVELQFDGLDTYAKVYLNDSLIITADNMFRAWKRDCKKFLKEKNNHLLIQFESAVKKDKEAAAKLSYTLPGDEKVFTRKAAYLRMGLGARIRDVWNMASCKIGYLE